MKLNILNVIMLVFLIVTSCSKDDNPITPSNDGAINIKLDTIINVDLSDAIVTYHDSVSIRIPQGTVAGDTKLTIEKLIDNSIPDDDEMEFPDVYEITLGEQHIYDKSLEITLKFDPEKLNDGKLKYKIGAAYYNETLQRWSLFQNVSVDTLKNTVLINTNHLTKLSWYHLKYALGYTDYITSPHFIIYWTDGKVPSNTVYNSSLTHHKGTAPHYIQDILYYMEEARGVYETEHLTVPKDTINKAEIRVLELDKGEDGNTSYFGFIRISQNIQKDDYFSQEELVKITCAHELFHYVQDYYYMWTFEGNIIKWWLEATAVQADRIVWPGKSKFEAISYTLGVRPKERLEDQLEKSWDDCNEAPNYYVAGGFLTYLTTYRDGAKLSIPEIIRRTGKASDLSYFRTILSDYLVLELSGHLIGTEYRDYIKWAYENKGPIKISYIPATSTPDNYIVPVEVTTTDPVWKKNISIPYMAAKIAKINSPGVNGGSFKITRNKNDIGIMDYVYISTKDNTTLKKFLPPGDSLKVDLLDGKHWIDILCINSDDEGVGNFDLRVELVQAPTISSINPSTAKVGETVQIKGNNFGASQNNSEIWFGTVKALASDIVSWINNQIDVKVPEGAETGDVHVVVDGEESNDVSFIVGGEPVITNIIDYYFYRDNQGIRKFTLPDKEVQIEGQFFGDYPDLKKVYVNNIEAEVTYWADTLARVKLPEQPTGNITVKLVSSNGESNEFPYFSGLPVSYLNSAESIKLNIAFYVKYFNAKANRNSSSYIGTQPVEFSREQYSWNGRVLTVDLDGIENINGTAIYTFSEDGLNMDNVEIEYTKSNSWPNEIIHYTGSNFPYRSTLDFNGYEYYDFFSCGEDLEQSTTTISGSINYVDDLRADFDGVDYSTGCAFNTVYLKLAFAK